jgi:phosphoglycolate phosphatase
MNRSRTPLYESVLFDLDGTLADTAPDLAAAANQLLISRGLEPKPLELLRPMASMGARGLIKVTLGLEVDDPSFLTIRDEFLNNYENAIHVHTELFQGIDALLIQLDQYQIPWGIVTNKQERFTHPLVKSMGLDRRTPAIVSGDTTQYPKPHPAPILLCSQMLKIDPSKSIYVGDDLRDIQAGHAAGMHTIAAAYGYCGDDSPAHSWGATYLVQSPHEIEDILFK